MRRLGASFLKLNIATGRQNGSSRPQRPALALEILGRCARPDRVEQRPKAMPHHSIELEVRDNIVVKKARLINFDLFRPQLLLRWLDTSEFTKLTRADESFFAHMGTTWSCVTEACMFYCRIALIVRKLLVHCGRTHVWVVCDFDSDKYWGGGRCASSCELSSW